MSAAARVLEMPAPAAPPAPGVAIAPAVAHLLSPSQVNEWLDCSARWYYHHALRLPDVRTAAFAIGETLHAITAACLRIRNRGHWGAAAAEQGAQLLEAMLAEELAECRLDPDEQPAAIVAQARAMFAVWLDQVFPHLETAVSIELRMEGAIAGVRVQGTADVITGSGMVVDLKTAGKKPAGVSQAHRLQLATYAMLADQAEPAAAPHTAARLYTITKTRTPAAVQNTVEICAADRAYAEWAYATAQREMREGIIVPRRSSLLCSRKNCAYWQACEEEYGGCVRD
jgi:hypothetical protein